MRYEEVVVGADIGQSEFVITPEMQRDCIEALEDNNPRYFGSSGAEIPIAHPMLVINYAVAAEWVGSFPEHIQAQSHIQFLTPTRVGKRIYARSKVCDKYIRRGRAFVVTELACVDQDCVEVMRCELTDMIGTIDELDYRRACEVDDAKIRERYDICGVPKKMTLDRMRKFSGHVEGGENFHTNETIARRAGFLAPIAQGLMSCAYILEMILSNFGDRWLYGGNLEVKYLRYVYPGDTISAYGIVRNEEKAGSTDKITIVAWCENQRNEKAAVGMAIG